MGVSYEANPKIPPTKQIRKYLTSDFGIFLMVWDALGGGKCV